ncbi:hypothetical protein [Ideonella sp.]
MTAETVGVPKPAASTGPEAGSAKHDSNAATLFVFTPGGTVIVV